MPSAPCGPGFAILEAIAELNEADPALSLCRCGSGSTRARRWWRSAPGPEQGEGIVTGDVVNTASRLQGAAPVDGVAVSRADVPADGAGLRLRGARAGGGERARRSRWRSGAASGARPVRVGRDPHARDAARRSGAREDAAGRDVRAVAQQRSCQLVTSWASPGSARADCAPSCSATSRSVPDLVTLAPGPLPAVRRRDHLLGARGDRQGGVRNLRVRLARGGSGEARAGACPRTSEIARWLTARLVPLLGIDSGQPAVSGGVVHGLAPLPRGDRRGRPDSCSCSRTCTGRTCAARLPRVSGRLGGRGAAARSLHRPPGAVRAAPGLGGRARATRRRSTSSPLIRRRDRAARLGAAGADRATGGDRSRRCSSARAATRSTRRSSCGCSPTAALEDRRWRDGLPRHACRR